MVQRELPGLEQNRHRTGLINAVDRLPTGENIILSISIIMVDKRLFMRAGQHVHAAIFLIHIGDRQPCCDPVMRLKTDIAGILMPADIAFV